MQVTVMREKDWDGSWHVWVGLDGETPPHGYSFIVGVGSTPDEAKAAAVAELEAALDELQKPTPEATGAESHTGAVAVDPGAEGHPDGLRA